MNVCLLLKSIHVVNVCKVVCENVIFEPFWMHINKIVIGWTLMFLYFSSLSLSPLSSTRQSLCVLPSHFSNPLDLFRYVRYEPRSNMLCAYLSLYMWFCIYSSAPVFAMLTCVNLHPNCACFSLLRSLLICDASIPISCPHWAPTPPLDLNVACTSTPNTQWSNLHSIFSVLLFAWTHWQRFVSLLCSFSQERIRMKRARYNSPE